MSTQSQQPSNGDTAQDASVTYEEDTSTEMNGISAWGTPWGTFEAGWDGEDTPIEDGAQTTPCSSLKDEAPAPLRGAAGQTPPPGNTAPGVSATGAGHVPAVGTGADVSTVAAAAHTTQESSDKPMTLMEHLGELRMRLVRCFIAIGIAFMACYGVADVLFKELCRPLVQALPEGSKLIFTALPEAFFVYLQVGLVAAVFVASPYLFYQIWAFIAPGLYEEEKRYIIPLATCSAILFLVGAAFCYLIVFPFAFTFFIGFANESIAAMPSLKEYLGFSLKLLIAFGLIAEMPLFTFFLARMGLISADMMRNVRRYAILVIFIVAAILTPPDVISQLLMACPMIILYEVSIWIAVVFSKRPPAGQDTASTQTPR